MTRDRQKAPALSFRMWFKCWAIGLLGTALIRMLMWTLRLRYVLPNGKTAPDPPGGPVIYALWHAQMFIPIYAFRGRGATVLISRHRDGEYIDRVVRRMGFRSIRGSTTRGGTAGLMALVAELEAGHEVAVTPDGPKGPRHVLQPGVVFVAEITGCPIIPMACAARRCWRMGSWDRFIVPKPFTTAVISMGEPVHVPPDLTDEERERWRGELERILADLSRRVEADIDGDV